MVSTPYRYFLEAIHVILDTKVRHYSQQFRYCQANIVCKLFCTKVIEV